MIKLDSVFKSYQTPSGLLPALTNIRLQVKPGEIFGIIGKSGAGKSTLIRCVNLLERPSQGKIIVDGENLMDLSPKELRQSRRKIGMIFQNFNLLATRTVYENIALPLELYRYSHRQIESKIIPLLEITGLKDKKDNYPAQLSGGQKQRVAIARALAFEPKILLSDEATSSLDPQTTKTILQLLKNIRDELKLTILLITHEMSVIKTCCDDVAILDHGEIIEQNEVGEFFSHPKTPLARDFVLSTLEHDLPDRIAQQMSSEEIPHTHALMRIWFFGSTATQPIISQLIKQFGLKINILQGNIEYVKQHPMGVLIVAMDGDKNKVKAGQDYLQQVGIQVEVLGYVPNDIIPFV
jgi:D-methionine transport system ATP-binding protein